MSIESNIEQLTIAVDRIAKALEAHLGLTLANAAAAPVPVVPVVEVVVPAPVVAEAPVAPAPVVVEAPVAPALQTPYKIIGETLTGTMSMPPLPDFTAPAPAPQTPVAPFSDVKGMTQYVTETWKALGPKGAKMQEVIIALGHHNINEIRPDQYGALYAGIEALRHGA